MSVDLAPSASDFLSHLGSVPGWLFPGAAQLTVSLLRHQTDCGLTGDVLEIGVYHGRYFIVLANETNPGERAVAVDIFRSQRPLHESAWGDLTAFTANVETFVRGRDVVVIQGDSTALTSDQRDILGTGYRFVSVDGGHDEATALSDLRLAEAVVIDGGLVALDDWSRDDWPEVAIAEARYRDEGGRLVRVVELPNKLLLTTDESWAQTYREVVRGAQREVYAQQTDFETTIHAWPDRIADGAAACERLLSRPGLSEPIEACVRRNATWYLPLLAEVASEHRARQIVFPVREGWSRFNPSVALNPDGELLVLVRSSNYTMDAEMRYTIDDPDGVIRTTNYLGRVSDDLTVTDVAPIEDQHLLADLPPFPVSGFEDARLFWWHSAWYLSATLRDRDPEGICHMAMARLRGDALTDLRILSPSKRSHEKNWMPLPVAGPLRFIVSCYPTVTLWAPRMWGTYYAAPLVTRWCRGGSPLVALEDGRCLAIVHEAVKFDAAPRRVYQHRFLEFMSASGITRLSRPFCFHNRGIEFAAGLAIRDDELIVSYGIGDAEAWLMAVPLTDVLAMLEEPLPEDGAEKECPYA